jgi:hypothetical protein
MNTVMRTIGGALGGQFAATLLTSHTRHGLPTVGGFTATFAMSTGFLVVCMLAALLIPGRRAPLRAVTLEPASDARVVQGT